MGRLLRRLMRRVQPPRHILKRKRRKREAEAREFSKTLKQAIEKKASDREGSERYEKD